MGACAPGLAAERHGRQAAGRPRRRRARRRGLAPRRRRGLPRRKRTATGSGRLFPPVRSASGANAEAPQVALDAAGNAVAVWSREEGVPSNTVIQAAVQSAAAAAIARRSFAARGSGGRPAGGIRRRGQCCGHLDGREGQPQRRRTANKPSGGAWSPPLELSQSSTRRRPRLAFHGEGNRIAVWSRYNGANTIIQAAPTTRRAAPIRHNSDRRHRQASGLLLRLRAQRLVGDRRDRLELRRRRRRERRPDHARLCATRRLYGDGRRRRRTGLHRRRPRDDCDLPESERGAPCARPPRPRPARGSTARVRRGSMEQSSPSPA